MKVIAGKMRKAQSDEASELKVKRKALQTDASADDFAYQAAQLQKLPLMAKANGM